MEMKVKTRTHKSDRFEKVFQENIQKECQAAGCTARRHRIGNYCNRHGQRLAKNGHPLGLLKEQRSHDLEDRILQEVLSLNFATQSVQHGLKRISQIIEAAGKGSTYMPLPRVWQAIHDRGFHEKPEEVLFRVTRFAVIAEMERPGEYASLSDKFLRALQGNQILQMSGLDDLKKSFAMRNEQMVFLNKEIGQLINRLVEACLRRYAEQFENQSPYLEELTY